MINKLIYMNMLIHKSVINSFSKLNKMQIYLVKILHKSIIIELSNILKIYFKIKIRRNL
jgi:hypothetical protein